MDDFALSDRADEASQLMVPPHSMEAEQSLLGGLLLENSAWDRIADVVSEADFYRHEHRLIFRTIAQLVELSRPADVITVQEELQRREDLEAAGGFEQFVSTLRKERRKADEAFAQETLQRLNDRLEQLRSC